MKNFNLLMVFAICLSFISANSSYAAQAGSLDNSFSSDGKVLTQFGSYFDVASAVIIQSNGKIVVAGSSAKDVNFNFAIAVARYNADGTLDNSFSGDGKVTTSISQSEEGKALAIQSDGKILVAGSTYNGNKTNFFLVRYNSDGTLDATFNNTGTVSTSLSSGIDNINGIVIQADGKIVVAGMVDGRDFVVARYNSDGTLDNTFNGQGWIETDFSNGGDEAFAVELQSDGKILASGRAFIGGGSNLAIARYNADGTLDNTFSSNGKADTYVGVTESEAYSMALQADGKIILAGFGNILGYNDMALVRYNSDGTLDLGFSGDGKLNIGIGSEDDDATCVKVQTDGKILVGGYTTTTSGYAFALVRLNADGTTDNTFGAGGKVTTNVGGSVDDNAFGMALQSDGKVVLVGYGADANDNYGFAVARYNLSPVSGMNSLSVNNPASIYPVPANELLNLTYTVSIESPVTVQLLDMQGRQVLLIADNDLKTAGQYHEAIGFQNLVQGVYYVMLTIGTEQQCFKVLH